jgi:glycerol-3-phosphate O-acyltransferase 3/4
LISEKAGLRNSLWNGYLKSSPAIKDRDLLKVAFRMTYLNRENLKGNCLQGSRSSEDGESCSSLGHGKFYSDNQIDQTSYLDINIYGNIPYKTFINEMNKEYHLLKCMPYNEQHVLILDLLNKSSSINFSHMPKKGCSCRKKAFRYLKKKHGFRNCRMDMLNGKL